MCGQILFNLPQVTLVRPSKFHYQKLDYNCFEIIPESMKVQKFFFSKPLFSFFKIRGVFPSCFFKPYLFCSKEVDGHKRVLLHKPFCSSVMTRSEISMSGRIGVMSTYNKLRRVLTAICQDQVAPKNSLYKRGYHTRR